VADWRWEPVTDDLLDELPPAAVAAVRQVAEELTIRESMIFLDGRDFTGEPPGLRTIQRGPLMLVYLTDVRGEKIDIFKSLFKFCYVGRGGARTHDRRIVRSTTLCTHARYLHR